MAKESSYKDSHKERSTGKNPGDKVRDGEGLIEIVGEDLVSEDFFYDGIPFVDISNRASYKTAER